MVKIYVKLIRRGLKTLESVPAKWRDKVAEELEAEWYGRYGNYSRRSFAYRNARRLAGRYSGIVEADRVSYRAARKKVEEHNQFARRMPLVEQRLDDIEQDVNELKQYHKAH